MALLRKLLVANRGEIALRIIRSARKLGILTVAVYLETEREASYIQSADESVSLGHDDLKATFLNIDRMVDIAVSTGCDAIHPGYGFLSESPEFATACLRHGVRFVGPDPETLRLMGNKTAAKELVAGLGIPVARGHQIEVGFHVLPVQINFPLIIKAIFGGGGKGMKVVNNAGELQKEVEQASRMAQSYFGNGALFAEQYIPNARHVEVQLLGDQNGNIVHLFERDCSIQRNHQKLVEEAPATFLSSDLRNELIASALRIGRAVHFTGAGTVEYLIDERGKHYFMEMNPRIQVEHAVTELITGIDLVAEQLTIASGLPLSFSQEEIIVRGHAIEARIYAEDPAQNFLPSASGIRKVNLPMKKNIRIEADLGSLGQSRDQFDPLLFKLIAWGEDRASAISQLTESVRELNVIGPATNVKYLETTLTHTIFLRNNHTVEFCSNQHQELTADAMMQPDSTHLPYLIGLALVENYLAEGESDTKNPWKFLGHWRNSTCNIPLLVDGQLHSIALFSINKSSLAFEWKEERISLTICSKSANNLVLAVRESQKELHYVVNMGRKLSVSMENTRHEIAFPAVLESYPETSLKEDNSPAQGSEVINSPLHGRILKIHIRENQRIKKGDVLLIIESMKTENQLLSHRNAKVKKIAVNVGTQVTDRMPLIFLEDEL